MSKLLLNFLVLAITAIFPTSYVYAKLPANYIYHKSIPKQLAKTVFIRVTSTNPKNPNVKLDGAILQITSSEEPLDEIHTTTPLEMTVTGAYTRYILKTTAQDGINIEVFERTANGDVLRTSGGGRGFDGLVETTCDDDGCFLNSGIVAF